MSRWHADDGVSLVELLVTTVLLAVIGASTLAVTVSVSRAQRRSDEVQTTLDTTRIAVDRVRRQLRGARRVLDDPSRRHLQLWIDRDGDDVLEAAEVVHYQLVPADGGARLETWTGADPGARRVVVRGLDLNEPFAYAPPSPATRLVDVSFVVDGGVAATAQVRLRNVE